MRSLTICTIAAVALTVGLSACQRQEERADAAGPDNVVVNPPDNVTVVRPDATPDVNLPDVNINPPRVDADPPGTTTRESTTVTVPGVGSQTTTVEKRD